MNVRAIPRKLLIHSVIYQYNGHMNEDGNMKYDDSKVISHIRIEASSAYKQDKTNTAVQLSVMMIYDSKNSLPQGLTFIEGDAIVFDEKSYTIVSVDRIYDNRRLHHLEIGLV